MLSRARFRNQLFPVHRQVHDMRKKARSKAGFVHRDTCPVRTAAFAY
ncbi:hypothetical protein BSLA_01r4279 [Burkholderia stabilis]|nr:hypothetical protein BSLA_01r4279 [Burkholderia stabilis]